MGKTRFAEAVTEAAVRQGMRVAWGWCSHDDAPPYGPWTPALRTLDIDLPAPVKARSIASAERQRRFIEVADHLRDTATRTPLILVLEDLHCADAPSLQLLQVVASATPGSSLLVLATCRDDPLESSPEVWRLLSGLPPVVERVVLAGLDPESTRRVAEDPLGGPLPEQVGGSLYERTGGNPFFSREVGHLIASRGAEHATTVPSGVSELLQRRLARLTQECHTMLGVAAVAGEDADVGLLCTVTGHDEASVLDLRAEATRARLINDGQHLTFVHALVREVCYASLATRERAGLHRAVAAYLEDHAQDLDAVAGRLSFHWFRAGQTEHRERAAGWALRAEQAGDTVGMLLARRFRLVAALERGDFPTETGTTRPRPGCGTPCSGTRTPARACWLRRPGRPKPGSPVTTHSRLPATRRVPPGRAPVAGLVVGEGSRRPALEGHVRHRRPARPTGPAGTRAGPDLAVRRSTGCRRGK